MKKCPSCNQTFSDDNYFCLEDGTTLLLTGETGANPPVFPTADNATTQIISRPQISRQTAAATAPKNSSKWLFLVIGILATAVVGMGVFMFAGRGEEKSVANQNTAENTDAPKANQTIEQPKSNPNLSLVGSWSGDWHSSGSYRTNFTAHGGGEEG